MSDAFDPQDLAAAADLDARIDRVLTAGPGPDTDPTVLWLAASLRADPPPGLARRVEAEQAAPERVRWRPVQVAAAALAALLLTNGLGSLVNGAWVADNLGQDYSSHAYVEGGLALLATGIAVAAGLFRRSWIPVSVAVGVPLGLILGVRGVPEVGEFAAGAVLHLGQGAVALVLAVTWWRARRYGRAPADEGGA